ncbi:MAG: GGDEF domain-containing protein [Kineosporiaceae bacterium]
MTASQALAACAPGDDWHRAAFEFAPVGIAVCALDGTFLQLNRACRAVLSGSGLDLDADRLDDLARFARRRSDARDGFGEDWPVVLEHVRAGRRDVATVELPVPAPAGDLRWVRITVVHVGDALLCHLDDVTSGHGERERLARLALRDALTGLANRRLTAQRLDDALERAQARGRRVGVCYLDLDGFKQVNDTLGHDVGDQLLVAVAQRLTSVIRADDTAGRLGGDEFVVVAVDLRDDAELDDLARRVRGAFEEPVDVAGRRLRVGASVGTALSRPGESGEQVVQRADASMFATKRRRRRGRGAAAQAPTRRAPQTEAPAADVRQLALLDDVSVTHA